MKKSLIALAVLGTVAGAASAQSSVTLYGAFMLSAKKTTGVPLKLDQANGTNWVGVRGAEDLGSGNRAIFDIQWRFSPESGGNDGSNNARPVFQGKTAAGLAGSWGTLEVGRMLSPFQISTAKGDPFVSRGTISLVEGSVDVFTAFYATDPLTSGSTTLGAPSATGAATPLPAQACSSSPPVNRCGDGAGLARTDMFQYTSPNVSGFTLNAAYGFKNSAASGATVNQPKAFNSFWLQYNNGPLYVGLGREQNRIGDKVVGLNAWYDFGVVKLSGGLSTLDRSPTNPYTAYTTAQVTNFSGPKGKSYQIGAQVPFGAFMAKVGYASVKEEGSGLRVLNKVGIGGDYALSSRTYIFSTYGRNKNKATNVTTKGADIGIRHLF